MAGAAATGGSLDAKGTPRSFAAPLRREGTFAPAQATVIVVVVGLLITLAASWTAWTLNRHNEHNLLEVQTRQAAAVVSASILSLRDPLQTTLEIENATASNVQQFDKFASTLVGPGLPFVSVVLWQSTGGTWRPVSVVGVEPLMASDSAQAVSFVTRASKSSTFVVTPVPTRNPAESRVCHRQPEEPHSRRLRRACHPR